MPTPDAPTIKRLVLVPALVTLAVTLLRLAGELMRWSPTFFSREGGGAGALVGIVWLVPVFGIYFALKLAALGQRPARVGAAIGYAVLAFALMPASGLLAARAGIPEQSLTTLAVYIVVAVLAAIVAYRGWPALGRTLLAYGLAARVPVVIVMLLAILGNWGTHYDAVPPGFLADTSPLAKWFLIGVLPQLTIWIWFTLAVGAIFGGVAVAVSRRRRPAAAA